MAYGTVNADVIGTSVAGSNLGAGNASLMKNRIINGAMVIDQRNAGASVTITNTGALTYTVDRMFAFGAVASKFSVQQNAGSVTPPTGYTKYLGCTSLANTSLGAGDAYIIGQAIEGFNTADLGWGTANAKTVTLSFQVYSSLTGTFGGCFYNGASSYSYPFSYSIPVANTWTSISITITGPTAGTWTTDNSASIQVVFSLGSGTSNSGTAGSWSANSYRSATGATSVVGTSGATFYITGVQLEVGSSATGFEYRQQQQELALCQRYYWRSTAGAAFPPYGFAWCTSTSNAYAVVNYPVPMRAAATTLDYSTLGISVMGISTGAVSDASINSSTLYLAQVNATSSATFPTGFAVLSANNSASSYIGFGAEL